MRLTRVEIHGFKSFADRVQLDLPPGLTAVVGPNGCGKSNVIDAIKWALGEQRPSALRGDEMLDVIFKGNGARTARNFAEVSLHFDNADRTLPIDFSEVVVTRRLFRSGESEYLINRQPQRLKDVRNLLMDTGLGTGAYSIMEQGRIDAILSADAQDRRRIFEEAAGISRYRARRRESESKLERTDQNLLRLADVIGELEARVRSLKQQAGRARSFLGARDRLRGLKARFYVHRWEELGELAAGHAREAVAVEAADREARAALHAAREELAALQAALDTARAGVDAAAEEFRAATNAVEALGQRRAALREREADTEARGAQLADRLAGLQLALQARAAEAADLEQRLAALAAELAEGRAQGDAREAAQSAAEATLAAARADEEARRRAALERLGEQTEWKNRRAEAEARHGAASASLARIGARVGELERQLAEAQAMHGEAVSGARSLAGSLDAGRRAIDELATQRAAAQAQSEALDAELAAGREKLAASESRREALAELLARHEGLSPGARTLLESGLPGIEGLVVDRLRAPRELAEAVEAALGATAEAVVVSSRAAGLGALQHLQTAGAGRVLLLPRDAVRPRPAPAGAPGQPLLERLRVLADHELLAALLGHVRLLPDRAALHDCPLDGATVWVTPQGEVLDERGVLRGGRVGGEGGLVTRRAECDALEGDVGALRQSVAGLAQRRQAAAEALAALEGRTQALQDEQSRLLAESERAQERELQGEARRQELERDLSVTRRDAQALETERAGEQRARDEADAREQQLAAAVAADRAGEEQAARRSAALEQALEAARAALGETRLRLGTLQEREQSLASEARQVERARQERAAERERALGERDELAAARAALRDELSGLDARETELTERRDELAGALATAREHVAGVHERLAAGQARAAQDEEAAAGAAQAMSDFRLREQETAIHRRALRDKVLEELSVDLEQGLPPEALAAPVAAPEETEDGEVVQPAAAATAPDDGGPVDWAAVEREIETLRERMARMGNVNLAAVDELREVDERLTFLVGQRDDLLAAKAALEDTIRKVDSESRERFTATFEEIREHFRHIFRKLFRGGKADVFLAEGQDVLEAGIEIVVAPPGKDPRSISLLSGGERTLTAVGLLFALFRARPSPVCMLDEVDAALDETNIDRFCTVLEDFLQGSQFVVVTHARRTMSYADTLYGITMQEHGVSRALSLTLKEYDEGRHVGDAGGESVPAAAAPAPRAIVVQRAAELEQEA
jgi:chromosome segregation protein